MSENNAQITTVNKIDSITIIGKRWFDRINGNTYFSATGLINGKQVVKIDFDYGYGDQYIWEIFYKLDKLNLLPDVKKYNNGSIEALWSYCDRNKIEYYATVSDVKRKKDL